MNLLFYQRQFKLGQIRRESVLARPKARKMLFDPVIPLLGIYPEEQSKTGENYTHEIAEIAYVSNNWVIVNNILFTW